MSEVVIVLINKLQESFPDKHVLYCNNCIDPDSGDTFFNLSIKNQVRQLPFSKQDIESSIKDKTFDKTYKSIESWMKNQNL